MATHSRDDSRRSLLAWIRAGLWLLVVGALIAGASLELSAPSSADRMLPWIGATLMAVGVLSIAGSLVGYQLARVRGGRMTGASEPAARVVVAVIVIAASLLIVVLIADAC